MLMKLLIFVYSIPRLQIVFADLPVIAEYHVNDYHSVML